MLIQTDYLLYMVIARKYSQQYFKIYSVEKSRDLEIRLQIFPILLFAILNRFYN